MEPGGSNQDGGVVNMTRAMEAVSPWLNNPRKTIIQVEGLVVVAAALLLLQLILGSCRRRWHNSFIKYSLQVCNGIMFPLIVYTLGTMQSSPIKNSSYPVWAAFLIMASAGTTAVQQYDFYDSFYRKFIQTCGEWARDFFYLMMFYLLLNPNTFNMKTAWDMKRRLKQPRASSKCVWILFWIVFLTKLIQSLTPTNKKKENLFITQGAGPEKEETTTDDPANDSDDSHSMKGYKYAICYRLCGGGLITIDKIWDSCGNSSAAGDGNALKDLCLSYALSQWLLAQRYFGCVSAKTSRPKDRDFVFKKLLPSDSEVDFQRAFRVIEVELGFCYDFFFTKYIFTFFWTNTIVMPLILSIILLKIILILVVGVFAIRKSLVLETPNPIIQVHISEADYIITLLVLSIALLVELVQAAFYLASNWAQVSLACTLVKKHWYEPNANNFGKFIGLLRWVLISQQLRNKIDQHSVIFGQKKQPDPVQVSGAIKKAIARSLRSTYANNRTTTEEISARLLQNQMLGEYSWALENFSHLEVMLIWHIATEYCTAISDDDPTDGNGTTPSSNHRRGTHLFAYVLQLLRPDPRRNMIASDRPRDVAVHLSRYCAYLIGSVPELLPYHEVDIAELAQEVTQERKELFKSSYGLPEIYSTLRSLPRTKEEEDNPTTMFNKGVKLGKQLKSKPDCWEVLQDFWAKEIIHFAASHYTTKQHMQHLENGGEFLTHIWALLAHAGILNHKRKSHSAKKDQNSQTDLESGPSVAE